uniref:WD_REPEATS_REGION domain-containing protein n=1 Tax=Trichuris muris TaxID=70415 RepID=A0A5S6R1V5_TRIMR
MLCKKRSFKSTSDCAYPYARLCRRKLHAVTPNVCLVNGAEFYKGQHEKEEEVAILARNVHEEKAALVAIGCSKMEPANSKSKSATGCCTMMKNHPTLVALRTAKSELFLHSFNQNESGENQQLATLKGHEKCGFGVAWSEMAPNVLFSGDYANQLCWWIVTPSGANNGCIKHSARVVYHTRPVNDVAWSRRFGAICGSVGDDGRLCVWDLRGRKMWQPVAEVKLRNQQLRSLAFSPTSDCLLATGDITGKILLWDWRNISRSIATCGQHVGPVNQLQWSPHKSSILASGGEDGVVGIWDVKNIEKAIAPGGRDAPETVFLHTLNSTKECTGISWSPLHEWTIASVFENSRFEIWQPLIPSSCDP